MKKALSLLSLPIVGATLLVWPMVSRAESKAPPFLKVEGLYIFDGSEDDVIKVLETTDTSWIRVQSRVGESWINMDNVTTVVPITREAAAKSEMKEKADFILDGAQAISVAIDDYATKHNLPANTSFKWEDIRKSIKSNAPVYNSSGKDVAGRPYIFGSKISDGVKVNADTIKEFGSVIPDPDAYWGKFKP